MTAARILLASSRPAYHRLFAILAGHKLLFVTTVADAEAALADDSFDLIMIGTSFDESRMFELLQMVRADGRYASVSVICFRGIVKSDIPFHREAVEAACKSLGATAFFDLAEFPDDAAGNAAVRRIVADALGGQQAPAPPP